MTDDSLVPGDRDGFAPRVPPDMPSDTAAVDPLVDHLAALQRDDCFRVDAVLKTSPVEETQRVYFAGANGAEQGPYIRKYIDRGAGIGAVYRELYRLRQGGRRLRYLPAVYDCHEAGGRLVVVMECARGLTLRELVDRTPLNGRVDLASRVFPALCDAAAELHGAFARPVVHRDLTPSNVVCPADDPAAVTVVDLGIARAYKPDADSDTAYFGTRPYAPPEQFGFGQTDVRTDVYALGMVLFFCLTGRDATRADRSRSFADPAVPEPLRAVVERAARLEPAERYQSATELKGAFEGALESLVGERRVAGGSEAACDAAGAVGRPVPVGSAIADVAEQPAAPDGAAVSEASAPRRRRLSLAMLAARVPAWVGRVWNALVLALYALLFATCILAVAEPVPENAGWPLWFRIYSYPVFLNLNCILAVYLLLDRRRIGRRFPALARRHPVRELLVCLGLAAADWVLYLVIGLGSSALGLVEL